MSSVQLAPDGKHLAFRTTLGTGHLGIALMDIETGKIEPLVAMNDENITEYYWKGSDRIVFGGDVGGNESLSLRSIGLKKRTVIDLAQSQKQYGTEMGYSASVIDRLRLDPNHILIEGTKNADSIDNFGVFLLDVRTGDRDKMQGADVVGARGLFADNAGIIRALNRRVGDVVVHQLRPDARSTFYKVGETPADVAQSRSRAGEPLAFAADNQTLYVLTREGSQSPHLRAYDVPHRAFLPGLDYVVPGGDLRHDHPVARPHQAAGHLLRPRIGPTHAHWFDAERASLQAKIDAALPDTFNRLISSSDDGQLTRH